MSNSSDEWPGEIFIDSYRADLMSGSDLNAPKWSLRSKTARLCIVEAFKGHTMTDIDNAVDSAREVVLGELNR